MIVEGVRQWRESRKGIGHSGRTTAKEEGIEGKGKRRRERRNASGRGRKAGQKGMRGTDGNAGKGRL